MKKLIIIGNGFDKAHNLKTNYNEFIENLFTNKFFKDQDSYRDILKTCPSAINTFDELLEYLKKYYHGLAISRKKNVSHYASTHHFQFPKFANYFIELLLLNYIDDYRWCDIESEYFKELMLFNENDKNTNNPKILNDDFENVKEHLSNYLLVEEMNAVKINSYEYLFKSLANSSETLILNFNYTRTIENLYKNTIKCPLVHIHGEIESKNNPIIFGYAANQEDSDKLLKKNDEYIKNIKRFLYKRTNNETLLKNFLGSNDKLHSEKTDVFIFGHSCGLSDNLILNEIFNHSSINSIKIFFHESWEKYSAIQTNIHRIMKNDTRCTNLIVNFQDSHRMPQWDDDKVQVQNFSKYIRKIKEQYPVSIATFFM